MPCFFIDSDDDPTSLTIYLDRANERPEQVFADAAQAISAVLQSWDWVEERLEQVGISLVPGPEPHEGRWSVTISFGATLSDAEYDRLAAAVIASLCARGYVDGM